LKQKIALGAALLVLGLAAESVAQPVLPFYRGMGMELPPREIVGIVRAAGMDPVSRPVLRGRAYSMLALDPDGQVVRVEIGARRGRILRIAPAAHPRYADIPPSYSRPPGLIPDAQGPDDIPNAYPGDGEDTPTGSSSVGEPVGPSRRSAIPNPSMQSAAPPLPRPRPKLAAAHSPAADSKPMQPAVPPTGQGADAKPTAGAMQGAPAQQGADAKQGAEAKEGADGKHGIDTKQGAKAKEATGAIATSANPSWHGIEQQE
jgi:hypothetical protein